MIAGLEDISSGEIRIGDRVVNHLPPRDRDIAMVFQNYALYQHMSVYDNLAFGLRNKKTPEPEIRAAVDRAAEMLGLHGMLDRKPGQLSGGQQQRVALAVASCAIRRYSCSTSPCRTWTPSCAPRCASRSSASTRRCRPRPYS